MSDLEETRALGTIRLNEEFQDGGQDFSPEIRLWFEVLILIAEDLDFQRQLLQVGKSKGLSLRQLEKLINSMNRVEYHLQKFETPIQEAF